MSVGGGLRGRVGFGNKRLQPRLEPLAGKEGRAVVNRKSSGSASVRPFQCLITGRAQELTPVSGFEGNNVYRLKDMSEEEGPVLDFCPERILDQLTPTEDHLANHWRERCRERVGLQSGRPAFSLNS
jgi:hypothetical protein